LKWYSVLTPGGYAIWLGVATLNIFSPVDPVTNLVVVCIGSLVAGFGIFYERRRENAYQRSATTS